ncbi:hypothetical protein TNCV_1249021 [Trichonephila clavipes]|nr:hypothetical protein TNCV_1249021 [Trichonephila clavipes]
MTAPVPLPADRGARLAWIAVPLTSLERDHPIRRRTAQLVSTETNLDALSDYELLREHSRAECAVDAPADFEDEKTG